MTPEHINKFFTLLMGKVWTKRPELHIDYLNVHKLVVLEWMREYMPDTLEAYCDYCIGFHDDVPNYFILFIELNLRNLYQWLIDNPGWGEKECPECKGVGSYDENAFDICEECEGEGRIIHPALQFARGGRG